MKITEVLTVNIGRVDVTDQGKRVYRALLSTGARTTEELSEHTGLSEGLVDLMLAHLLRHDLIKIECKWQKVVYD